MMKRTMAMTLILCLILSMVPTAAAAEAGMIRTETEAAVATLNAGSDFYYELVEDYEKPDIEYRTEVRWWMAEGGHTDETLLEEVQAIYDAGFRGVELCQLNVDGMDETTWGYGSEQWNHDFHLVLNKCLDLGMTIGMTAGTNWSTANVPGLDPDSPAANQCVIGARELVEAGAVLTAKAPPQPQMLHPWTGQWVEAPFREKKKFLSTYAYGVVDADAVPITVSDKYIDLSSFVTVDSATQDVTLTWTAPAKSDKTPYDQYLIFYCWTQGTAQLSSPSVEPAYCINYFDEAGLNALKEYWLANVLNDSALNAKIKRGDVQLFMDSLEYDAGNGFANWTDDFAEEFKARKGYDITPYLFLAFGLPQPKIVHPQVEPYGVYNLTDAVLGQQILNDFHDVQTQLYMEELMIPFKEWLNSYGITLRAQISYGKYLENSEPIATVNYPEAETLNQENQIEMYRTWSGGSKLQNKVLSSETSALNGTSYAYPFQWHLKEAYTLYAAGFSRMNWHIWTSQWAPESVEVSWPGFRSNSSYNVLSTRYPSYDDYVEFNDHLGRVQQLLREGKSRTDIGMIYTKYGMPILAPSRFSRNTENNWLLRHDWMTGYFESTELQDNGYTYDYFSPDFLSAEGVYFDEKAQTLELAGYKALVLWQDWLDIDGAKKILDFAKQGLKVVVVDGAAQTTPYHDSKAGELTAVVTELKALDTVRVAASADDVLEALQALGVTPYAAMEENHQLLTQVRQDGDDMFLYAYNYCDAEFCEEDHGTYIETEIAMDGTFVPYYIDAWTGEVVQVANYRWENGRTVITVSLEYGDIALYAFEAVETEPRHIVSTNAEKAYVTDSGITIRATESGTVETVFSNGLTVQTPMAVPTSYDITDWDLTVESWTAGEEIKRTDTFVDSKGNRSVEHTMNTEKTNLTAKLSKMTTWDNISSIGPEISGIGTYEATFNWDGNADGAYVDFGNIVMTLEVYINGTKTADVNMSDPVLDIGQYLVKGENAIKIVYNSNLQNAVIKNGDLTLTEEGKYQAWPGYRIEYLSYGPSQAKIIPYVEETYDASSKTPTNFNDLASGAWYTEPVSFMINRGYMTGTSDTTFSPNTATDFATAVTSLCRFANGQSTNEADAMAWAVKENIVSGNPNPTDLVTREQLAVVLYRYANSPKASQTLTFTDAGNISADAQSAVVWCVENGILNGYSDNTLRPTEYATRAEMAKMMTAFIQLQET